MPTLRSRGTISCARALASLLLTVLAPGVAVSLDVLTDHYNNQRTGTNLSETILNQVNVAVGTFGKLYSRSLDGYTYAQPLYVSAVAIAGGTHNVVYVATENNSVYAFDADDAVGSIAAYWSVNLGPSVPYPEVYTNGDTNITPLVGITGTPVIDRTTGTLYVVSLTKEAGPSYHQRLHALDIATGSEKFNGPAEITYSQMLGSHLLTFNPKRQNQRPGLALANGSIYIAWASFGDIGLGEAPETAYNGYVMRYDAGTLAQQAVFVAAPNGSGAGIWQVGCGPAVDASGNVYLVTGNGTSTTDAGGNNFGESTIKFTPSLTVADYFTPYNKDDLNNADLDLGVSGHVLVDVPGAPVHKHLMIHGSKEGKVYVLDRDAMGHFHAGDDSNAVQVVHPNNDEVRSAPVYWMGPAGPVLFVNGQGNGGLVAMGLNGDGTLTANPLNAAQLIDHSTYRGSHMTVSSNGAAGGTGVLWSFSPTVGDPIHAVGPGILRAFNAETLQELYNSELNAARDSIGNYPKYVPPTVANGRVFVPTFSGQLQVFGLVTTNPELAVTLTSPAGSASFAEPATVSLAATASAGQATVAMVRFYANDSFIGESDTPPYAMTWTDVTAGTYVLQAEVMDSQDATATSLPITITVSGSGGTGTILHQMWTNIGPGINVVDLTSVPGFPNNPSSQDLLTSFEGPTNIADDYGSRIVGYVYPPLSGLYTFWIASDDSSQLWLSSDDNPANAALIAEVDGWTNSEEWGKYASQQSLTIRLVGGERYFIQALQKEGGGGDNLAVGWQLPNGLLERPILGAHLSPAPPAGSPAYGLPYRGALPALPLSPDLSFAPPATLSATGVFASLATLTPVSGIVPYVPNTPLWSDAAVKSRWIALPNGARITFAANGEWAFPGGTVFIKHFELGIDDSNPASRIRLETRLLVLDASGANGYGITYKWRADNSDADLVAVAGMDQDVTIANAGGGTRVQTWHYPSQNECLQCHLTNAGFVLGAKTRQLNGTMTYPSTGLADNQLRTWNALRMFTTDIGEGGIPAMSRSKAVTDTTATLEDRVKSYVDANCAQCHRPGGIAGWDARYDTPMAAQGIIGAVPVHGNLGILGALIVTPGVPGASVLPLRMSSTTTGTKMPPLARNLVDTTAVGVVDQWIGSLPSAANGSGLTAQYWSNQTGTFTGPPTLTRIDPVVNFDWGTGSPDPSISTDHFTARWTGQLLSLTSETYTFSVTSDDGFRLWVNGQVLIDAWVDQPPTTWTASIALAAGQQYAIRMDYYENAGGAVAQLAWSSPSIALQTVPQSQLFPAPANLPPVVTAGPDVSIALPASALLAGSATDDGIPGPLVVSWSMVSGPGPVTFANAAQAATSASFAVPGTYDLRLTASDGVLTTSDDMIATVAAGSINLQSGGIYTLAAQHSGMLLDVSGASIAEGAPVIQWPANGGLNQQWKLDNLQAGLWRATSVNSGKVLTVSGGGTADGTAVIQSTNANAADQSWYLSPAGNGYLTFAAASSGKCLDISGGSLSNGANAVQDSADGAASQHWLPTLIAAPIAAQNGFNAVYYDNIDFSGPSITRIDPVISFDWGLGSPDPAIGVDTFSARWTARVTPPTTETYTFYTTTDDGVRLWVDGQLVIDRWVDQAATTWSGSIALTAGQAVNVRMDFYENGGYASAVLEWSSASVPRQIVPVSAATPSGLFAVNINFQPASAPVPAGYLADTSLVFGDRGNGYSYGWNAAFDETRQRGNPGSPDERYDTLDHMQKPSNPSAFWEIAVPNGSYQVRIVSGDSDNIDSIFKLAVENVLVVDGTPAAAPFIDHWIDSGYQSITVSDGRLTVTSAPGASNNKICFIQIFQQPTAISLQAPAAEPPARLDGQVGDAAGLAVQAHR